MNHDHRFPLPASNRPSVAAAARGAESAVSSSASSVPSSPILPHHRLIAYGVARELLLAVSARRIRDAKLRDEAVRSAKS
ncbi:MAG TPA: hypothetical protein VLC54_02655, partial [Anaeromyxobacter sp.]|nr:hypothetical protein [Anaeromyxobacter sp.]